MKSICYAVCRKPNAISKSGPRRSRLKISRSRGSMAMNTSMVRASSATAAIAMTDAGSRLLAISWSISDFKPGDRVLDVGCAKGFLVHDLMKVCPGLEAFGVDISEYALMNCLPEVVGRLHIGSADHLPFPDKSFAAVISINTIHNLERERALTAVHEVERLAPGHGFIQVDSYHTPEQRELFLSWVLTAKFHDYPDAWRQLFSEAGYTGDYYWTIV